MLHKKLSVQQGGGGQLAETKENPVSFLIEGFQSCNDPNRFPEVSATIQIASANKCSYFDSISSFDSEHIGEQLKNKSEKQQKAILLNIYLAFIKEGSTENIIEHLLKKPYQDLVSSGVYKEVPAWLNSLSVFTIEAFAKSVLEEVAHGSIEEFKQHKTRIRQESDQISDRISIARFLEYVKKHPSITTVYGLIGSNHLDMLNSIGVVSERRENYRLIKISVTGRADIEVHLFGGIHGEMAHYEQLASHIKQKGLIVPIPPAKDTKKEEDTLVMLLKLLLSSSSQSNANEHDDRPQEEDKHSKKTTDELAKQFDYWMKHYNHPPGRTHNEELVDWLTADGGAKHIKTYGDFCALARLLSSAQYNYSTQSPPLEVNYNQAMEKFTKKQPTSRSPDTLFEARSRHTAAVPKEEKKTTDALAQQFDYWMKHYNHSPGVPHNEELVDWLTVDSGAEHIKKYSDFCELARLLNSTKYNYSTQPPPSETAFNSALQDFDRRQKYRH